MSIALNILNDKEIPFLIRVIIFHYFLDIFILFMMEMVEQQDLYFHII